MSARTVISDAIDKEQFEHGHIAGDPGADAILAALRSMPLADRVALAQELVPERNPLCATAETNGLPVRYYSSPGNAKEPTNE